MSFETLIFTKEDRIVWLTLNRPEKLNALVGAAREELYTALDAAEVDQEVRAVVITGAGKGFCAGGDIDYMAQLRENNDVIGFRKLLESGRRVVMKIQALEKPVVAMINGAAAGAGLNLALACDIRIAAETAKFSQAFAKIGLHPDWGGSYFLPRLIGTAHACEMIFTGDTIDAREAWRIGLVNRVVPAEELLTTTRILVAKLVARPPRAIALAKRAIYQSLQQDLSAMLDYEMEAQTKCFQSEDAAEGIQAFQQRREPNFKGK
ncbi:MAG: enoyl-CoA hydratase [Acidobacteriota bacterium]